MDTVFYLTPHPYSSVLAPLVPPSFPLTIVTAGQCRICQKISGGVESIYRLGRSVYARQTPDIALFPARRNSRPGGGVQTEIFRPAPIYTYSWQLRARRHQSTWLQIYRKWTHDFLSAVIHLRLSLLHLLFFLTLGGISPINSPPPLWLPSSYAPHCSTGYHMHQSHLNYVELSGRVETPPPHGC